MVQQQTTTRKTKDKKLTSTKNKDYNILVKEVVGLMEKGLNKAYKTIDNIKVQTYWQIGERIVREELKHKNRAEYGKFLIDNLSTDLEIRKRKVQEIIQFYRVYPNVRALRTQLSWRHYIELIRLNKTEEREFYFHI